MSHQRVKRSPRRPGLGLRVVIPAVLAVLWLSWTAWGGQVFGVISEVTTNDQATFLPADAESTRALDLSEQFTDSDSVPATIIAAKESALSPDDLAEARDVAERAQDIDGVDQVIPPQPSEDQEAVQILVLLAEDSSEGGALEELRTLVADDFTGDWTAHVTGPAAFSNDLTGAFAGIDGLLLVVALVAVFVILVVVYRSILLPVLVLLSSMAALCAAISVIYLMAQAEWIQLNGQVQGILSILVIGAATDYSLLLVARYREELLAERSRFTALWTALRRSTPPVLASGGTVAIALLCLLFSDLNSNRALGPVAAAGIVFSMAATLTFLPALLALTGRWVFWPRIPRSAVGAEASGDPAPHARHGARAGLWGRVARGVEARPRAIWIVVTVVLLAGAVGVTDLKANGIAQSDVVLGETETKAGQELLEQHFDAGTGAPANVFVESGEANAALTAVEGVSGVASAYLVSDSGAPARGADDARVESGMVEISATLADPGDSLEAEQTIIDLRDSLAGIDGETLVGGTTATQLDTNETAQRDLRVIIPLVLLVIGVILIVLLRSLVTPLILIATTVLSYLTALGISAWVFNHLFQFPGADPTVPLFGFMFLVALGVDYNIFLMTRAREEARAHGAAEGLLRSLVVTGGVITSAGIVLAATFSALAVLPLMFMVQLAFLVALGVFIDTFIVRTLQVPALGVDLGRRIWWPSRLARAERDGEIGESAKR